MHNHRTRLFVLYAAMMACLGVALCGAAHADASVRIGISDDGAMLADGGLDWAAAQGVRDVRFQVRPGQLERYDRAIADASQRGLRIIVNPLGKPDTFPEHAARIAARWPQVDAISAYNEPELNGFKTDPCGYVALYHDMRTRVRKVRRHLPILFGEFSPHGTFQYLRDIAACPGGVTGLRHISFHPYQWSTDPLSPKQLDSQDGDGGWLGIGRLPRVKRWLARRSTLRALGIRKAPRISITEFAYMERSRGMELATPAQIRAWWPRAKMMAERLDADTLVAQGAVTHGEGRNWNSSLPTGLLATVARG